MKCATCNETNGCEHIASSTDVQQQLIKTSKAAAGNKQTAPRSAPAFVASSSDKVDVYVPAKRDYTAAPKAGESRGPSVIMSHGPAGPSGQPGERGLSGRDGISPSIGEVVDAATIAMEAHLRKFEAGVSDLLNRTLEHVGVIDSNGRAILLPGPTGAPGAPGQSVVGPVGQSIKGDTGAPGKDAAPAKDGRDGRDGDISEATLAAKDFVTKAIADLVTLDLDRMITQQLINRNVLDASGKAVRGEKGETGAVGVRGPAGSIDSAMNNCSKLIDEKLASFRAEPLGEKQ